MLFYTYIILYNSWLHQASLHLAKIIGGIFRGVAWHFSPDCEDNCRLAVPVRVLTKFDLSLLPTQIDRISTAKHPSGVLPRMEARQWWKYCLHGMMSTHIIQITMARHCPGCCHEWSRGSSWNAAWTGGHKSWQLGYLRPNTTLVFSWEWAWESCENHQALWCQPQQTRQWPPHAAISYHTSLRRSGNTIVATICKLK